MPRYGVEYKRKVVKFLDKYGMSATTKKFGHDKSVIYRWQRKSETVGFMRKKTKTYSFDEKVDILNHYWKNGIIETERLYDINCGVVHKWERLFREFGVEALSYDGRTKKTTSFTSNKKDVNKDVDLLAENQRLRMELEYLKKLDALVREREKREQKKK